MKSHTISLLSLGLLLTAAVAWTVMPETPSAVDGVHINASSGLTATGQPLALHGHDPVAYFTVGEPTLGSASHSVTHDGATYRFATAEHLATFEAAPERYLPAFGGYCAFGVTVAKKFDGDPRVWAIEDGRLYLNLNSEISELWRQDVPGNIRKANGEWSAIVGVAAADL